MKNSCILAIARPPVHKWQNRKRQLLALAVPCLLLASAEAGTITGTISNKSTGKYLERAVVHVEGTDVRVQTERDGSFHIPQLPAGNYTITASYTDLDQESRTIIVGETDTATANFELISPSVHMLEAVRVSSPVEGNAFAINQQRRAESTRVVTSIDAFIDQSTGNPGEFLKNVEGIQMDYSQNEPQTIRVRGFDPNLTVVTMDGNDIASASSSSANRAVQIDQLSISSISSVEVYKAPIPSMSANAIGGAVNFVTKSAFEQKGRRAFAQVGLNMDSNDFNFSKSPGPGHGEKAEIRAYPSGRVEYSDSFLNNRLGIVASLGYDHTNQLGSSTSHNLRVITDTSGSWIARGAFSMAPNRQLRVRADASINSDFKINEAFSVFLKTTFTDYKSTNRNHGFTLTPATLLSDWTTTQYTTTNGTASQNTSVFDKSTKSVQVTPGLKFRMNDWRGELVGGYSRSENRYSNPDTFTTVNVGLDGVAGWSMETPIATDVPTSIAQTAGKDFYSLSNYKPTQSTPANKVLLASSTGMANTNKRDTDDTKYSARFDLQRSFKLRFPFYLKAGAAYNDTIFDKKQNQRRWSWAGDDGILNTADDTTTAANLGRFAENPSVNQNIPGWALKEPEYLSTNALYRYWVENPQVLVENMAYAAQQKIVGSQKVDEQVKAGYFMGNATIKNLSILAGLRVEKTQIETTGYKVLALPSGMVKDSLEAILATYEPYTTSSAYTSSPFPYLHLKYELARNLQLRTSYTEAIGRPNLSDLIASGISYNETDQMVTVSNRAGLLPQRSQNYDFSIEYYTKSAGQWTAGVFHRDITDYIATVTTPMTPALLDELGIGPEFGSYQIKTKNNLGFAKWTGFELSFRQSLRDWKFVPSLLSGFSLWANYTKITKMDGDFGTPGVRITSLANVVPELINAGVSYRSRTGKFFVQVSTNYQGTKPTSHVTSSSPSLEYGPNQRPLQYWNMEAQYRITPRIRLSVTGRNLCSERPKYSDAGIIRNTQQATGIAWLFAARYDL